MSIKERVSAAKSRGLGRMRLCGPEQDVAFLAKRQLDHALRREMRTVEHHGRSCDRDVVDLQTASIDMTLCFAERPDQSCELSREKDRDAITFKKGLLKIVR